jgi:hypothetical protein
MLNEYLGNIANAIREKLGKNNKINAQDFANKVGEVYDKGCDDGQYNFMSTYQVGGGLLNGAYFMFAGGRWNDTTFYPVHDIVVDGDAGYMFKNNGCKNLRKRLNDLGLSLTGGATIGITTCKELFCGCLSEELPDIENLRSRSMKSFCSGCSNLKWLPDYNTAPNREFDNFARNCTKLERIEGIDFTGATTTTDAFLNCTSLYYIRVNGTISISLDFSYSPLDADSTKSVITHLKDHTGTTKEGTQTIKFKSTSWDALEASGKPYDDGLTDNATMTWQEYVSSLGWLT